MAAPEHTPDGRYVVVDGRRWRATDPAIPEEQRSRAGVQAAKVALGERGRPPWWEQTDAERRARWSVDVPVPEGFSPER